MENQVIKCQNPNCGIAIGSLTNVEGYEWLKIGGVFAQEFHGVCAKCGRAFHWSVNDRTLELLLKRVLNN